MSNESVLREQAREAILLGKVPSGQPDRLWGGDGVGAVCIVCRRSVAQNQIEVAIEFARNGPAPGLDKYHLHLGCFAAWEFERARTPATPDEFHSFLNGLQTRGSYCLRCLSQMYSESVLAISRYLSEIGIPSRHATCANCNERRETFRSDCSL